MFKYRKTKYSMDIVYPNKMSGGLYTLGPLIIYNMVNNRENWYCERVFLDKSKITAPLVGFSLQYEPDLKNILKMKPKEGLTFVGGPVVNNNLKIVEKHFDFMFLGDIEVSMPKMLDEWEKGKEGFLDRIAKIEGIYVPGKNKPTYSKNKDLDEAPYPLVQPFPEKINDDFVFGKCFMLEVERGCPFCCKFCAMKTFYKTVEFRSLENIKEIIDEGIRINKPDKIVIYAPSFVHPNRKEILRYLQSKNIRVVVPSIKAEHTDRETLELIHELGQQSLTIAPETGEKFRMKLNKKVKDEAYFKFIEDCNEIGIKKLKVYMMIGFPDMEMKDLEELVLFVKEMKKRFKGRLYLSVNYLIPKPGTPFEKTKFDSKKLKEQGKYVKKELSEFRLKLPLLSTSLREWKISNSS